VEERIRKRNAPNGSSLAAAPATARPATAPQVVCVGFNTRCDFMGNTATRNMCSKCYRGWTAAQQQLQQQQSAQRPVAVPVAHPTTLLQSPWGIGVDSGPCLAQCGFMGSRQHDFLCSKCYAATQRMQSFSH
jgi:hypothetical protein